MAISPSGARQRPRTLIAGAAVAVVLGLAGCGDDEETTSTTTEPTTTSSAPTTSSTTSSSSTTSTTSTTQSTTSTTTGGGSGGVSPGGDGGNYDPDKPDTADNDRPPEPGSPEEDFEQQCEENPEACG